MAVVKDIPAEYQQLHNAPASHSPQLVSVVVPCFNTGEYLIEAVESVRAQNHKDVELVVVDDGSTDKVTRKLVDEIAGDNTIVVRADNHGPSCARNLAVSLATGDYILPLDSDDCLAPDFITQCLPLVHENPQVGVAYGKTETFGNRCKIVDSPLPVLPDMLFDNCVPVTALYRKQHWLAFGGYKSVMSMGLEDHEFWLNFFEAGLEFRRVEKVLLYYRRLDASRHTTAMVVSDNHRRMMLTMFDLHRELYNQFSEQLMDRMLRYECKLRFEKPRKLLSLPMFGGGKFRLLAERL